MSNFRHFVTIQENKAAVGLPVGSTDWQDIAPNVPCNIHDVNGKETFRGLKLEATTNRVIEMRFLTSIPIKPKYRAKDSRGRIMSISNVNDKDGRERFLYLLCTEVIT